MDLSFSGFDDGIELVALPTDLSVLLVGIAARQAASTTALAQARFVGTGNARLLLEPLDGAFNGPMATTLRQWKDE